MPALEADLQRASAELSKGGVAVIPTDTVYGLAARPDIPRAIARVFELKQRSRDKQLPVLGAGIEQLATIGRFDERALRLARRYWPGPLTLVVERRPEFNCDLGGREDGTIALRVPRSDPARRLLALTHPLAVTSANRSGETPAGSVRDARALWGNEIAAYLDGGECEAGIASTVVSVVGEEVEVLRAGPINEEEIAQTLTS